ncbi:N-ACETYLMANNOSAMINE-6-P EPIMERASE [Mycoplasmopsis pulmonis]|uniref:Putative N-acetylmannosamine-6-phosphate 2-epimerase n=1 Tax=Mycoplasmopsis pulmonis (strain UAB CTIP) TaxID=272635 RepID=NANE_MYCPU|nr:N-acetylmannosamine-6-phosphate 2-epimerase [Mycoplasmopsis pulmonis]Q98QJ8.1 RecName: Full=Putative N-acetylmannosamine-6-phosphate 2-epimerase; AltName: Full=ManNAc-6-P epimerase [Mycoplasmopsis pulmonis UAB CTIP]MDZ7293320.1 N-acetylmannosamine-6-phosphate 2-epimerase [Mycoplasmopsis pulmonis]CAC13536.1 N-ACETYLMANNOSAMINE-6-P EPIMERASE [Mycoplasmopsis pulmonis]
MFEKKLFFVSCQALKGEALYGKDIVVKLAKAAIQGGAQGLRTSQIKNIKALIRANFNVPIIGIIKQNYPNSDVYISPTLKEMKKLIKTGVQIIAIDATLRKRPKESLNQIVDYFFKHKKSHQLLMADCSSIEDVNNAIKLNFDIIGTTLRGYTEDTKNFSNTDDNYLFLRQVLKICQQNKKYLIAEGGFNSPQNAKDALDIGANAVVVGSAITRPQFITKMFYEKINS